MEYSVVVHEAEEGGFWVEVPALPGCFSQGESVEEALGNVREAIAVYLEVRAEDDREGPGPQPAIARFKDIRVRLAPFAEAQGWLTDEDVFKNIS